MSRRQKEEYHRFFTVNDSRSHDKGYTEYRITARFVSKSHPEDVKEVVVWRRFSELKKLHGELAFTHRNLFRREEEFPPFPRAQVFGRFEEAVIEERRRAAEAMLQFTTSIPALYNSPQLRDFFRDGEVSRPLEPSVDASALPPPLIPLPRRSASCCEAADEEQGREAPTLPQDLDHCLDLPLEDPELAAEAFADLRVSPEEPSDSELDDRVPSPIRIQDLQESQSPSQSQMPSQSQSQIPSQSQSPSQMQSLLQSQDELDELFESVVEEPSPEEVSASLSETDLASFDPYFKQGHSEDCSDSELFSLPCISLTTGGADYLSSASSEITAALKKEREGDYGAAIIKFRTAVDLLITGVQGDPDASRREAVLRRTALYLKHVETLVEQHSAPGDAHT